MSLLCTSFTAALAVPLLLCRVELDVGATRRLSEVATTGCSVTVGLQVRHGGVGRGGQGGKGGPPGAGRQGSAHCALPCAARVPSPGPPPIRASAAASAAPVCALSQAHGARHGAAAGRQGLHSFFSLPSTPTRLPHLPPPTPHPPPHPHPTLWQGITLKLRYNRAGHLFEFPVLLSHNPLDWPTLAGAYAVPPLLYLAGSRLVVGPLRRGIEARRCARCAALR